MKTKTHFIFRVDIWDDAGDSIVEHVAGADEFEIRPSEFNRLVASIDGFWRGAIPGFGRHMVVEGQPDLDEFLKNAVMV